MKVLVINPGATSTKISVFEEQQEELKETLQHSVEELRQFARVADQSDYRRDLILKTLEKAGYKMQDFDAVCGRGGLTRHIPSGTYAVNEQVLTDIRQTAYGEHAANLGVFLAKELADMVHIPAYFVDPICVDEFSDLARISGFEGMERESIFHALNQKRIARETAKKLGKPYEAVNLIVLHLGGGVSVAAHEKGRVVDVTNVKDDGAMGLDRGGALPVHKVIEFCFSGKSKQEVKQILGTQSGVYSYLGTKDFRQIEAQAVAGEAKSQLIFRAFAYQLAKDVGAMAAVLHYDVDAIVYTGGIAYSERFCSEISSYIGKIAPIFCMPGEEEMRALAEGALRVLHGEPAKVYG